MTSIRASLLGSGIALAILGWAVLGCGHDGDGSSTTRPDSPAGKVDSSGITASVPVAWHSVSAITAAEIPLQVASFRARGRLRTICNPHNIVDQIPSGGAFVQLLEDTVGGAISSGEFPPLHRPFRLGPPEGHECGEAYNIFFRQGGRAFQLRVWTAPTGLSRQVRRQIQGLVESLKVQSSAEVVRAAVRASRLPRASGDSPFIALDCARAPSFTCDRLYFSFSLSVRARSLHARVAGRTVRRLHSIGGVQSGSARSGYHWEGVVYPAGLTLPGSPLFIRVPSNGRIYWGGRPPVKARVWVSANFPGGSSVSQTYKGVRLQTGHG